MSANDYATIIARLNQKSCDKVEKDFFPRDEWAKRWNIEAAFTNKRLSKLVAAGIMEIKKFRVITPSGKTYPTPHYKLKCTK